MSTPILVIDDDRTISITLAALLKKLGLEDVLLCHDPIDALKLITSNPKHFKALFIDLHMPNLDGLELIHRLDKLDYQGGIIIFSGLDSKIVDFAEDVVKTTKLKLLGVCQKPIKTDLLAFLVKRIHYLRDKQLPSAPVIKKQELLEALKNNQLIPYFQPKIGKDFSSLLGVELLARLELDDHSKLLPERFLPVVSKFGLYSLFFESLLKATLEPYLNFLITHKVDCPLSINIFPKQLEDNAIYDTIKDSLDQFGYPPELLLLEITEQQALYTPNQLKNLNRLKILGVSLSLDDFGSGFTNISQLKKLPLDEVKLDMQMITGVANDPVLEIICRSTFAITQALNIPLIAEGVEDESDLQTLEKIGIDGYQGYLISKPKPLEEFIRWFTVWSSMSPDNQVQSGIEGN